MKHKAVRTRWRHVVAGTALALAVAGAVPGAATPKLAAVQPGAPEAPGGVALTWAPTNMASSHDYTRRRAVAIARQHDLVVATQLAFRDHVAAMRRANPDLTILAYANGTLIKASKVRGLPESAFAHDQNGRRITSRIWGTVLMAPTSRAWRRWINNECRRRSAEGGYDGCMVDSMGLGIFAANQQFTGRPVNPATGRVYTEAAYRGAQAGLARSLREASPGLVHVFNCVENDWRYWRDEVRSRPLALAQPAVLMEDFLRGASSAVTAFPDAEKWLRNVQVVRDLEANDVTGLYATKLWVSHSWAQAARWQALAMATFLMGANGNSYFAFTRSRDSAGATGENAPYRMPRRIGLPRGAMVKRANGAYTRRFSNGMSVVNPTGARVRVDLPTRMVRLNGVTVTSLVLGPRSGEVLVEPAG